eukprot:CAMPEP_0178404072 /NCGR_PEP_ID=MMETSP0689_2-20121128/17692_1 /TAXON_ID=160604 /ORGANISM="Amphidinium massartii, Strain CS-259" /LENGTH=394 /DNA_ID=CAMNT_0020025039 /DNA_START=187 /DNA_END=1368 /DNA_ORIENTATION=+
MAAELTIYYRTGWQAPVLHYGFEGKPWTDATFAAVPEDKDWWQVTVPVQGSSLECVPRAADSSGWDNAPGGGNYKVGPVPTTGKSVAVIRSGEVALPNLKMKPWALVSDMDGTLIGECQETMERLRRFWDLQCRFAVRDGQKLCYLAYNSGRNKNDMLQGCRQNELPRPDFMICGVGTEIYTAPRGTNSVPWYDSESQPVMDEAWRKKMNDEFGDRDKLAAEVSALFPTLEVHGGVENDPYRLPCILRMDLGPPVEELQEWGDKHESLRVIISGMGDARFVDICSIHADKGLAIQHLFDNGNFVGLADLSRILVAGDSGNDLRMFEVPGVRSVMVGNSQPSLVEKVLEGQPSLLQAAERQELPISVPRPEPLLEVYFSKGHVGDGVCEAIRKYY